MDYGNAFYYHPLTKITVREKLILGLTFSQAAWIGLGIWLGVKMAGFIPRLPFALVLGYIHYIIPLLVCLFLGFVTHKSGQTFLQYFAGYIRFKGRRKLAVNRYFVNHREESTWAKTN